MKLACCFRYFQSVKTRHVGKAVLSANVSFGWFDKGSFQSNSKREINHFKEE